MKLLTYDSGSGPRCGVLIDDQMVDLTALLGADQTFCPMSARYLNLATRPSTAWSTPWRGISRPPFYSLLNEPPGTRTQNPRLKRPLLYQLSYHPIIRTGHTRPHQRMRRRRSLSG